MACNPTLQALVEAFEASGSMADRNELVYYIESATGEELGVLLDPEWSQVADDGQTRTKSISLQGCEITFTIEGAFSSTLNCGNLPTYTLPLPQNEFTVGTIPVGDTVPAGDGDYMEYDALPYHEISLEDARLEWLETVDGVPVDGRVYANSGIFNDVTTGGATYTPCIRINGSIRARVVRFHEHRVGPLGEITDLYSYTLRAPLLGFHLLRRRRSGDPLAGPYPNLTIDDPIRLGTLSSPADPCHFDGVDDTDYCALDSGMVEELTNDRNYGIGEYDSDVEWPWARVDGNSWADFEASVESYNATRTANQPTLEIEVGSDADEAYVTIGFEDKLNALYIRTQGCTTELGSYDALTLTWGDYYYHANSEGRCEQSGPVLEGDVDLGSNRTRFIHAVLRRIIKDTDDRCFVANTPYRRALGIAAGTFTPSIEGAIAETVDGEPPDTTPNPPRPPAEGSFVPVPPPVSGGCRSTMDGPASCNYNIPLEPDFDDPELPLPGDVPVFPDEFPEMPFPEMPIFDANYPQFPNFCAPPNFGQMTDCQPQPGTNFMPGGRDRDGNQGTNLASFKTGSELYGAYDTTFNQDFPIDDLTGEFYEDPDTGEPIVPPQRCWPANSSIMTAITTILLDLGVSPLNIVWEIGPEWDKTFGPHCFPTTTGMFDAAVWLAQKLMLRIIDEGAPSGKVYIGPPTHRPQSQTFTFQDTYYPGLSTNPPFANLAHGYSQTEAYYAVKVWGSHLPQPAWAIVDTPFAKDPTVYLSVQVGPNYTFAEAQELAFFRASLIRRAAVSVQVTVPYSENYYMRDTMVLQVPSAGYQETFTIFGKQSEWTVESRAHILTGVLPATLAELDQFPELLEEPEPLMGAFLEWPKMRSATKRRGERRLKRHLERREEMGLVLR